MGKELERGTRPRRTYLRSEELRALADIQSRGGRRRRSEEPIDERLIKKVHHLRGVLRQSVIQTRNVGTTICYDGRGDSVLASEPDLAADSAKGDRGGEDVRDPHERFRALLVRSHLVKNSGDGVNPRARSSSESRPAFLKEASTAASAPAMPAKTASAGRTSSSAALASPAGAG